MAAEDLPNQLGSLADRVAEIEKLLHGEPDPHADDRNFPRPEPLSPGLFGKVEHIRRFLGIHGSRFDPSSLDTAIYETVEARIQRNREKDEDRRHARSVRGRVARWLRGWASRIEYGPPSRSGPRVDAAEFEELGIFEDGF